MDPHRLRKTGKHHPEKMLYEHTLSLHINYIELYYVDLYGYLDNTIVPCFCQSDLFFQSVVPAAASVDRKSALAAARNVCITLVVIFLRRFFKSFDSYTDCQSQDTTAEIRGSSSHRLSSRICRGCR